MLSPPKIKLFGENIKEYGTLETEVDNLMGMVDPVIMVIMSLIINTEPLTEH